MSSLHTPSSLALQATDDLGRRLTFRSMTALEKLRLLKAAGPELSLNQAWLSLALLATSVSAIDDVPVPFPTNENQIESLVGRLGDVGLDAAAKVAERESQTSHTALTASAGNSLGTPS